MSINASQPEGKSNSKKVIKIDKQSINKKTYAERHDLPTNNYESEDLIFALDIGTRTVVGIVGIQEDDKFKVISAEVLEHKHRAMLDGQIHDIAQVADITREIKEKLEKSIGFPLTKVAIAAAGRVLRTCSVKVEREIDQGKEIEQELVSSLEVEGIQQAQLRLDEEVSGEDKTQYYCVGYSVINYYLNSYVISSLLGHRGKKIGVEILATFLPHIVVDSLYTVMGRVGLEVVSLTLEPIAAINVTIPKDLRLLNLALVDIGAGTSDIALTRDGSVVAYAMAPIAGDEITEKIAQHYLVDFNTGERIKLSLSNKGETIVFEDILGKKHSVKVDEVIQVIKPSIEQLALTISQKILEYNQKAPNAVFLIGGGSQVPGLTKLISAHLHLPEDRVVVRGREIIQNIKFTGKKLSGPEAITPFGIAITAQMQKGQDFLAVSINGKKIRLFNSRKLTVADALILVGFNPGELIGRTGKSIAFELNGQKKVIRGEYGKAAEIYVNDQPANLETVLNFGDNIRVLPAEDGKNAEVRVANFVQDTNTFSIILNSANIEVGTRVTINGHEANLHSEINNDDIVSISKIHTLGDLIKVSEVFRDDFIILVNGEEVDDYYELKQLDMVEFKLKDSNFTQKLYNYSIDEDNTDRDAVSSEADDEDFISSDKNSSFGELKEVESYGPSVIINGKSIVLKNDKSQYIFVDMFNYINFDLSKPQGNIVLKLNGRQAAFTDLIKPGDVIDIYWDR